MEVIGILRQSAMRLMPQESFAYGHLTVKQEKEFPFQQGYQLFFIKVNEVLMPATVTFAHHNLFC